MSEFSQAQREELKDILREVVRDVLSADFVADFAKRTIDDNETSRRVIRRNEPYIRRLVREELESATEESLAAQKSRLGREIQSGHAEANKTEAQMHAEESNPDWEYETTTGPRKAWYDGDVPPEGEGWMPNTYRGNGESWERFDYHEESYWMRPIKSETA